MLRASCHPDVVARSRSKTRAAPSRAEAELPSSNRSEIGLSRRSATASGVRWVSSTMSASAAGEIVALLSHRMLEVQRDLTVDLAEEQLLGREVDQQSVAGDRAHSDRPQPRGEAQEERRGRDALLCDVHACFDPADDLSQQCGVVVKLPDRAPPVIERSGAHREIPADVADFVERGDRGRVTDWIERRCFATEYRVHLAAADQVTGSAVDQRAVPAEQPGPVGDPKREFQVMG